MSIQEISVFCIFKTFEWISFSCWGISEEILAEFLAAISRVALIRICHWTRGKEATDENRRQLTRVSWRAMTGLEWWKIFFVWCRLLQKSPNESCRSSLWVFRNIWAQSKLVPCLWRGVHHWMWIELSMSCTKCLMNYCKLCPLIFQSWTVHMDFDANKVTHSLNLSSKVSSKA